MRSIERILKEARVIAVVGLSPNPERDSHGVAKYLMGQGYVVVPVNPTVDSVLGQKSYPDLRSVPERVDVVDVFRRSDQVMPVVEEAIAIGAGALWLQLGVVDQKAAERAQQAGLDVVMDRCIMVEHRRLAKAGGIHVTGGGDSPQ